MYIIILSFSSFKKPKKKVFHEINFPPKKDKVCVQIDCSWVVKISKMRRFKAQQCETQKTSRKYPSYSSIRYGLLF